MGKIVHPDTGQLERNLDAARSRSTCWACWRRRPRGNLSNDEETFLRQVLTTLRLNYVDEQKKEAAAAGDESKKEEEKSGDATPGSDV